MIPPWGFVLPGLAWRFTMLIFSTVTRPFSRSTFRTRPTFPFSLPAMTFTMSFFLMGSVARSAIASSLPPLQDFRSQGDDLHELLRAELARHGPEDAGADRLALRVVENRRVLVEPQLAPVGSADLLGRPDHHGLVDVPLLDLAVGNRLLDADDDDVADARVSPLAPAEDLDATEALRARVVGGIQHRLHLDHGVRSPLGLLTDRRPLDQPQDPPPFFLAHGPRLHDLDAVADPELVLLVVRLVGGPALRVFLVHGMQDDALDADHDGLVHLVAHHRADLGLPDSPVVHRGFPLHLTSPSLPPSGGGTS